MNLPSGIKPSGIAYSAANSSIYVIAADQNTSPFTGLVIRMDAASLTVQATVTVAQMLSDLAISGDGTQLYLAESAQQVGILNGVTLAPVDTIKRHHQTHRSFFISGCQLKESCSVAPS